MLRRRRQRREFREAIEEEVQRVAPTVEAAVQAANADIDRTELDISTMPGAAARCPNCRSRMRMQRVKDGRQWWTMWVCGRCREMYRPAEFPEAARPAGWKR